MRKKHRWKGLVFFLLALSISLSGCSSKGGAGGTAPDFSLKDLSGNTISLQDMRGKYVIIDFWATWCQPCLMSIPELVSLQKKYQEKGLVVLGISLDPPDKIGSGALIRFKDQYRIEYPILVADDKVVRDYAGSGGMSIPTMFFVDREGRIVEKLVGFAPGRVEKSIKRLLG